MSPEAQPAPPVQETHEQRIHRELGVRTRELIDYFEDKCLDAVGLLDYSPPGHVHMNFVLKTPDSHAEQPTEIKIIKKEQKPFGDDSIRGLEVWKEHGAESGNHFSMHFYIDTEGAAWQPPKESRWEPANLGINDQVKLVDILEEFSRTDFDIELTIEGNAPPF